MFRAPRLLGAAIASAAPASGCVRVPGGSRRCWSPPPGTPRCLSERAASGGYTQIYTFPAIRVLRALSRLKLAQTGVTVLLLPAVSHLYLQGQVSVALLAYGAGAAAFAAVMLGAVSHCACRVVGAMYLDRSRATLRVAHLSFWGHRRDVRVPVSDVMTLADTGDPVGELVLRLRRHSRPGTMYFSTRLGRVLDRRGFEWVFGRI